MKVLRYYLDNKKIYELQNYIFQLNIIMRFTVFFRLAVVNRCHNSIANFSECQHLYAIVRELLQTSYNRRECCCLPGLHVVVACATNIFIRFS